MNVVYAFIDYNIQHIVRMGLLSDVNMNNNQIYETLYNNHLDCKDYTLAFTVLK